VRAHQSNSFGNRNVGRSWTRLHRVLVSRKAARHAKAALTLQLNKTDANDAHGLAQVVRTGWFREVAVKSMDAQTLRMLLMARAQLVSQRQSMRSPSWLEHFQAD
jgi:transposase